MRLVLLICALLVQIISQSNCKRLNAFINDYEIIHYEPLYGLPLRATTDKEYKFIMPFKGRVITLRVRPDYLTALTKDIRFTTGDDNEFDVSKSSLKRIV